MATVFIDPKGGDYPKLSDADLAAWKEIPAAIASDCMNRLQTMHGGMKAVRVGTTLCGQARTVDGMVADNSAGHLANARLEKGEVLVIDGKGYNHSAVFGGLMGQGAEMRGAAGIVVDGAVRDVAELRELNLAVFSTSVVPTGPHKGHGGSIDVSISCAGCVVKPGDIILGDDDGVAVVPLERAPEVLKASQAKIAAEAKQIEKLKAGISLAEQAGIAPPKPL